MNATPPVRLTLDKVVVRVIQVPLRRPIVARLGEFKQFPFILTDVYTKEGIIGHSYLEPYRVTATKSIVALIEDMAEQQRGKPVAPFDRFEEAIRSLHLLGRQGVTLIAIAALDMAMWDALAKALGLPLVVMLGGTVGPVRAYNTNGLWLIPVERLADEASSLDSGRRLPGAQNQAGPRQRQRRSESYCGSAPGGGRRYHFDERL